MRVLKAYVTRDDIIFFFLKFDALLSKQKVKRCPKTTRTEEIIERLSL